MYLIKAEFIFIYFLLLGYIDLFFFTLSQDVEISEAQEGDPKYLAPELMMSRFGKPADVFRLVNVFRSIDSRSISFFVLLDHRQIVNVSLSIGYCVVSEVSFLIYLGQFPVFFNPCWLLCHRL